MGKNNPSRASCERIVAIRARIWKKSNQALFSHFIVSRECASCKNVTAPTQGPKIVTSFCDVVAETGAGRKKPESPEVVVAANNSAPASTSTDG